ncbi:DUF2920 family protein, partial [Campylobacter sp. 2018MI35]|uniref:DUF2920 family protein n=1 Tax=Campylobacter sp. 2018MI34 TaxID=2800582 RepID=UPI00190531E0
VKNYPEFTNLPKIYGGGSYGGYLSLLIAKIAPWYVDGVVDNSAITMPHIRHILGRETEIPEFVFTMENVDLNCYVKKYWTRNINSPFYLNDENYIIRSILNSNHLLIQQKLNPNIIYIHYHSAKDIGAPAKDKIELHKIYKNLGFDTTLHLIESEDQIDGKLIKSLEHGLRMTDKALFRQE